MPGIPGEEFLLCLHQLWLRRRGRFFRVLGGSGLLFCQLLEQGREASLQSRNVLLFVGDLLHQSVEFGFTCGIVRVVGL